MQEFAVRMMGVSKRYGDILALDSVTLNVEKGSIHAIVGENGAGKTTLMKALYGSMIPDSGEIWVNGTKVDFRSAKDALALGIGMVSQHYGIIGELTCLENLILGAEDGAVLNKAALQTRADSLAARMGFSFEWRQLASELSPAGAQKLEILKLLWRNAEIMILDEPTAMISPADADQLFESLTRLTHEGATVIIVTHRLSEVFNYSKNVTVLRGGKFIVERPVEGLGSNELAELIVGGELVKRPDFASDSARASGGLVVSGLTVKSEIGTTALRDCGFQVRPGEIVGIAGVDGNGQRELFRALVGIGNSTTGAIQFEEDKWLSESGPHLNTEQRIQAGLRVIPEDRLDEGVIESWSLIENGILGLQRIPQLKASIASGSASETERIALEFNTKFGKVSDSMASLSGGNQQRFVAARALLFDPKLLLAFQPARGLDLNSTARVYTKIREICEAGACALVVSFDLDELLEYCDRIVVLNGGVMTTPEPGKERDRDRIGQLMVGTA